MRIITLILAAALAAAPALAAPAAAGPINFLAEITDLDGKPMTYCTKANEKDPRQCDDTRNWTLSDLSVSALSIQEPNESGIEQVHRMLLAQEIYKKSEVTLDSKDTDLLCEAISKFVNKTGFSALMTARAWMLLDPARVKK